MQKSKETQTNQKAFNKVWNYYIQQGRPFKLNMYKLIEADVTFLNTKSSYLDTIVLDEQVDTVGTYKYDNTRFDDQGSPVEVGIIDSIKSAYVDTVKRIFDNKDTSNVRNFQARRFQREFRKTFKEVLENLAADYSLTTPSPIAKTVAAKKFASKYKK